MYLNVSHVSRVATSRFIEDAVAETLIPIHASKRNQVGLGGPATYGIGELYSRSGCRLIAHYGNFRLRLMSHTMEMPSSMPTIRPCAKSLSNLHLQSCAPSSQPQLIRSRTAMFVPIGAPAQLVRE